MSTVVKIALGIVLGFVVLIVGCGALIAIGTNAPTGGAPDTGLDSGSSKKKSSTSGTTKVRRFSGSGTKNIGTVRVPSEAVLKWTNSSTTPGASFFIINDKEFGLNINSQATKGNSAVSPGTYKNIDVTADGDWTITIKPR